MPLKNIGLILSGLLSLALLFFCVLYKAKNKNGKNESDKLKPFPPNRVMELNSSEPKQKQDPFTRKKTLPAWASLMIKNKLISTKQIALAKQYDVPVAVEIKPLLSSETRLKFLLMPFFAATNSKKGTTLIYAGLTEVTFGQYDLAVRDKALHAVDENIKHFPYEKASSWRPYLKKGPSSNLPWPVVFYFDFLKAIDNAVSPVVFINYYEASHYARWFGRTLKRGHARLLTKTEWDEITQINEDPASENIATANFFPPVSDWRQNEAIQLKSKSGDTWYSLAPVASFAPNRYGLYDIKGNVAEWCTLQADRQDERNPTNLQAVEGGSYLDQIPENVRQLSRKNISGARNQATGFRLALTLIKVRWQ